MKNQYKSIKTTTLFSWLACAITVAGLAGCKKAIDIGPPTTAINTANVFTSNTAAAGALAGIYAGIASSSDIYHGSSGLTLQQGLAADELKNYKVDQSGNFLFYTNSLNTQNAYYWPIIFSDLFDCNAAVNGISASTSLTPTIQQQLLAEAKFARAFIYFNAVNLYGDLPMPLTIDPTINGQLSRTPAATVMQQVIKDLKDAQAALPDNSYVTLAGAASADRVVPNKQSASALLARAYLYTQDWVNAEAQASRVISSSSYMLEPVLTDVFLKASRETIWSLQPASGAGANADASSLVMLAAPNGVTNNFALSDTLVSKFESGDKRFTNWVGQLKSGATTYYYAYKYKQNSVTSAAAVNEYPVMLRLAEQVLIRAEARAKQNNLSGALADLNVVRNRAGLNPSVAATQADLLTAIFKERRIELFMETGHRWFDLKRTGQLDAVMKVFTPLKGGTWASYKALMPVPASEISINPRLTQNPGY